jgi:hypothetical protein
MDDLSYETNLLSFEKWLAENQVSLAKIGIANNFEDFEERGIMAKETIDVSSRRKQ